MKHEGFSAGPWQQYNLTGPDSLTIGKPIKGNSVRIIATVRYCTAEDEANARLIADAPGIVEERDKMQAEIIANLELIHNSVRVHEGGAAEANICASLAVSVSSLVSKCERMRSILRRITHGMDSIGPAALREGTIPLEHACKELSAALREAKEEL